MDHKDILKDAARIVGDRAPVYGDMAPHFERAANLASLKLDRPISAYDVLIILESVKDARRATNPRHYDSHVDGINYRAFAAEFSGAEAPAAVKVNPPASRPPLPFQDVSTVPNRLSDALRAVDEAVKQ